MIFPRILILSAATLSLSACAPKVPQELTDAREAYSVASGGPAVELVPAELHKAHQALEAAETSFENDPRGFRTVDLAYIAERKTQLAVALASTAAEQRTTTTANADYQATQDLIMRDTKAQLGSTQSSLAATQAVVTQTSEQLAASKAEGQRTAAELSSSQLAGERSAAQLAAAEAARTLAESRTSEAMAALSKLTAVKEEARGLVITLSGSVLFQSDQATLLPDAQARLSDVADALLASDDKQILIEGHTDSQGSETHNRDLSLRRAEAVRGFLTSRGYELSRVRAVGIGESRPISDNGTAEGRANNRRVEIILEPLAVVAQ